MNRAGVVGCGGRGLMHIEAYDQIESAEAVACCDFLEERRNEAADRFGIKGYRDIETMVGSEQLDIVHIVTPPTVRVDVLRRVSDLGVPLCTVEKPISTGVEDWRALVELEHVSHTRFAVCHQFRWHPIVMKCREAIAGGTIGEVRFLDLSAGMNIAGQGTHSLNYGRSLIGDPRVVQVFGNIAEWDEGDHMHPGASTTEAMLLFDNGVRGLWTSGRVSPIAGDPDTPWQHLRLAAYGDRGRVNYEEFGAWEVVSGDQRETGVYGDGEAWHEANLASQAGFHRAMFQWLEDQHHVPGTNLADALHEWAVILALYQSALTHQPVDLADFQPAEDLMQRVQEIGRTR